ncbi:protocatechuate 3,4-dioxygenase subunit alpha [Pseudonocardia sp.]|jgi:protocatechuate 3,4-dioxygenase alpha subunit|uniref:protocatechuate 3,4-dioxygenase subunit alpha n=1 Tax=Pseudonocardia sp. TaxID=60912 RepID=UPI00261C36C3|nr:protocatechuate 3,4-dioxygenase subunit alpha [Pseudonocardia sp.]MCW2718369.1 protocatechuate 3,4-dioxygenase [Pseudonocardia sp.]MDT7617989.1 protocatechuate 3,4-dioxygenase, alpha subunit [Pseudonocardiales bacterium]
MSDRLTPSQTVGPFLSIGLTWPAGHLVVSEGTPGAVLITGIVRDGAGNPVPDGLVETWQADPDGRFDHPDDPRGASGSGFSGFGRSATDAEGRFRILTVEPGALGDGQAPHIDVSVFARGLLDRVVTRIYFPAEAEANAADPLLSSLPAERAATLIAVPDGEGRLRFDIRLRGEGETVFLTI